MTVQNQPLPLVWENELEGYTCLVCKERALKKLARESKGKSYVTTNPFPIRLGVLHDIIQEESMRTDMSIHKIVLSKLEQCYAPNLDQLAAVLNARFPEFVELVKVVGLRPEVAAKEMKMDLKLFMRGLSPEQNKTVAFLTRRLEQTDMFQYNEFKERLRDCNNEQLVAKQMNIDLETFYRTLTDAQHNEINKLKRVKY